MSLLGLLSVAGVHCAAEGVAEIETPDAGGGVILPSGDGDADAPIPDAGSDVDVADAAHCSADHWCPTTLPSSDDQLTAVWSFAVDDAIAATATTLLHWDGSTWTRVDAPDAEGLSSLWASSPNEIWGVARFNYRLVHGTRAAAGQPFQWSKVEYDPGSSPTLDLLRGVGQSELWAYGHTFGGPILQHGVITTASDADAGSLATVTWTTVPILAPTLLDVSSFWISGSGNVWLAGMVVVGISGAGGVVRGVPSAEEPTGYTWAEVLADSPGDYAGHTGIWGESESELWSIGNQGRNFRSAPSSDGGVSWTPVPSNATTAMTGIWGVTKNDIWVVGRSGAVRHWDGNTWSVSRLAVGGVPMWQDLNAVHAGPAGDVWAVGNGVALHRVVGGSP